MAMAKVLGIWGGAVLFREIGFLKPKGAKKKRRLNSGKRVSVGAQPKLDRWRDAESLPGQNKPLLPGIIARITANGGSLCWRICPRQKTNRGNE